MPLAAAADTMKDWFPMLYEFDCGELGGEDRPETHVTNCLSDSDVAQIELLLGNAAALYESEGYRSPDTLGPVIESYDAPETEALRVFRGEEKGGGAAAYVSLKECKVAPDMTLSLITRAVSGGPVELLALIAAHELFHASDAMGPTAQHKGRTGPTPSRPGAKRCYRQEWIGEGIPSAVGSEFAERTFSAMFPVDPTVNGFADNFVGLRPYYLPLNYPFEMHDTVAWATGSYLTSSFWQYLLKRFKNGDISFFQDWLDEKPDNFGTAEEDWLKWLDDRLTNDPQINKPLYIAYPSFLTDYANQVWRDPTTGFGGIAQNYNAAKWQKSAFNGCERVTLAPPVGPGLTTAYTEVEIPIAMLSGACIQVKVTGLAPNQRALVKVGALTEDETLADQLHLGLAATNDSTDFNCARATRDGALPAGLAGCLFEPVTGEFEDGWSEIKAARLWHASALRIEGDLTNDPTQQSASGDFTNLYVLSRVPPELTPELNDGRVRIEHIKIGLGLDTGNLTVGGRDVSSGSAGAGRHSRATTAMRLRPSEFDQVEPASSGYFDAGVAAQILGPEFGELANAAGGLLKEGMNAFPGKLDSGIVAFKLAESEFGGTDAEYPPEAELPDIVREFFVLIDTPLELNQTGEFDAVISGMNRRNLTTSYFSPKDELARLTVLENSFGLFHARIDGAVCIHDLAGGPLPDEECPNRTTVSGEIVKPFNHLYQPDNQLVSHETPGEILYNKYHTPDVFAGMDGGDSEDETASRDVTATSSPASSGGTATGSPLNACTCNCPDRFLPVRDDCALQCSTEWATCPANASNSTASDQGVAPSPQQPTPTLEAQARWFDRLLERQDLVPEVKDMLLGDFSTMSEETRSYLIRQYGRRGP